MHKIVVTPFKGNLSDLIQIKLKSIESCAGVYSSAQIQSWLDYTKRPDHEKTISNDIIFGAYIDDILVGFLSYSLEKEHVKLNSLFIKPQHQGLGVARILFDRFQKATNGKPINIRSTLNAVDFYQKNGFEISGDDVSKAGFPIKLMRRTV